MARLHVNINDETAEAIRELMAKREITATEVVRRAISLHVFLADAERDGQQVQTRSKRGQVTRVVIL